MVRKKIIYIIQTDNIYFWCDGYKLFDIVLWHVMSVMLTMTFKKKKNERDVFVYI